MLEEIKTKIENDKEILSVLPQNNIRNRKKYYEKLSSLVNEYQELHDNIVKEMDERYNHLSNIRESDITNTSDELLKELDYFNRFKSPMEVLDIDRMIFIINSYENENLDFINETILKIIKVFSDVGISLNTKSFYLNVYASQYIEFLQKETDANKIHEFFESLYWKCPNILKYIVVNFYDLYLKNEKAFEIYVQTQKGKIISRYQKVETNKGFFEKLFGKKDNDECSFEELIHDYQKRVTDYDDALNASKKRYLKMFVEGELDIKEFEAVKMEGVIKGYTEKAIVSDKKGMFVNLGYSLKEYQLIKKYKYILDECHELYNNKNDYKNIVKNKLKDIDKITGEIKKNNDKIIAFMSKNQEKECGDFLVKSDLLLNDLLNLYNDFDIDKIKNQLFININDNSSLSSYFELGISSYLFLQKTIVKCEVDDNIDDVINDINRLISSPYNTLINNSTYNDLEKLNSIVVDKYKLMGFDINTDHLEDGNITNFIKVIDNIVYYYYMLDIKTNFDNINFILKAKDILEKEKEKEK